MEASSEAAEARAQRIIAEALRKARLAPEKLALLPVRSRIKVELTRRLRRETPMSL